MKSNAPNSLGEQGIRQIERYKVWPLPWHGDLLWRPDDHFQRSTRTPIPAPKFQSEAIEPIHRPPRLCLGFCGNVNFHACNSFLVPKRILISGTETQDVYQIPFRGIHPSATIRD
jgi:hypothetical protein